jgi:hypothetical protein
MLRTLLAGCRVDPTEAGGNTSGVSGGDKKMSGKFVSMTDSQLERN